MISQNKAISRFLYPTSKSVTIPTSKVLATVCDIDTHSIQELNDSPSTNANMNSIDTSTNTTTQVYFDLKNFLFFNTNITDVIQYISCYILTIQGNIQSYN